METTKTPITFITDDADIYKPDGSLLLKFRKGVLNQEHVTKFYDNTKKFVTCKTSNRGSCSNSKIKDIRNNPKIMSNIIGYFDNWSPMHKLKFKQANVSLPKVSVYQTRFTKDYPEKYENIKPLIQNIDDLYKEHLPEFYNKQYGKAKLTPYTIGDTSFTTITTNVNYQTAPHKDKGDDGEGFGNLTVIEDGSYKGGETYFPEFNIAVDVRQGDLLFMDVHEIHCNLPIELLEETAKRISIVCYLRTSIYEQTMGMSEEEMETNLSHIKEVMAKKYNYVVAIPTYDRVDEVVKKTLQTLKDGKVTKSKIYLFVADEEQYALYDQHVPKHLYNKLVIGKKGITNQRIFISQYFDEDKYVVSMDDDVEELQILKQDKLEKITDIHAFFIEGYKTLKKHDLFIWGIYPVRNAYFMYDKITTDLRFIIGVTFGFIVRHDEGLQMSVNAETKEDYEQTILYFLKDGGVVRFNNVTAKTKFNAKGGLGTDRFTRNKHASVYLSTQYPELVKRKDRKNGTPEIKLKIAKKI